MGKTRAEIQKAYRERKKQSKDGEAYLAKERQRRRQNYIPSSQLNKVQLVKRNLKNRENLQRHRLKKKQENIALHQEETDTDSALDTSGYESQSNQLIVRLPVPNGRGAGPRRRRSRALANAYRFIRDLKEKNETLSKKYGALRKKIQRKSKNDSTAGTPRSKTEAQMNKAKLNEEQKHGVRKQLLLGNVMLAEISTSQKTTQSTKRETLHRIVSGKIVKKYRCLSMLSTRTGFCRHKLSKVSSKEIIWARGTRRRVMHRYKAHVLEFLQRDDNSRAQPGKADAKMSDGQKVQTRVLTDYISNLHDKYLSENPGIKISLETFRRIRPKHILLTSFISRHSCLCTKHQNMALQVKTLRREGIPVSANPESLLKEALDFGNIEQQLPENLKQSQWKRISVEEKGKIKYVTRIVDTEVSRENFISGLRIQFQEFEEHVGRVKTQYSEMRKLKENLPKHQMILHMDFAENYACKTVDEIQSAYWNQVGVTLHPIVVYYKADGSELKHQSFVAISDETSHTASTVRAILKKVMPEIKSLDKDVELIHYWTDSPTSQYRNKVIFNTVANHQAIFGVKARWNYFEAGHGKGPCDGLGGTTKRKADEAVRSGKCVIQEAKDFFRWAESSSLKSVKFFFVSSPECQEMMNVVKEDNLITIKGTMKVHAVVGQGNSVVCLRDVSCYCSECLEGRLCTSWRKESMRSAETSCGQDGDTLATSESAAVEQDDVSQQERHTAVTPESNQVVSYAIGEYVAAVYDGYWYLGKVLDLDSSDNTLSITFMQSKKQCFQWPTRQDVIWCQNNEILCKVHQPEPSGRSHRMFKLSTEDLRLIAEKFENYK